MSLVETFRCLQGLPWEQRALYLRAALAEPHIGVQRAAVDMLLAGPERHPEWIVDHFAALLPEVQVTVALQADELLALARDRILRDGEGRPSAFHVVAVLGGLDQIDLLVLGLGDPSPLIAEVAFGALLVRWRQHLQQQIATSDTGAVAVVRDSVAAAVRACAPHHVEPLGVALVGFGARALAWFRGALMQRLDEPFGRALASLLLRAQPEVASAWAVQLALDPEPALQRLGQRTLRERSDEEFAIGVAAAVAVAANGASERAHERLCNGDLVPWWPRVEGLVGQLPVPVACRLVALLPGLRAEAVARQTHLERFLLHQDGAVQAAAVRALHALRCPGGFDAVGRMLKQGALAGQRAALQLVLDLSPPQRLLLLAPLLGSPDDELREIARREIGKVTFQRFLACFDDMPKATRAVAARALAKIDPALPDRLAREIDALDPARRVLALRVVELLEPDVELHTKLRELLADPDRRVRATAIRVVQLAGSEDGMQTLLQALADPDRRMRANAIEALDEHGDRAFVPLLIPFLEDPDNRVRANAAKALWTLGWVDARDELLDMLEDGNEEERMSAAWALGQVRCPGARAALEARAATDPAGKVRVKIHEVLSTWPPSEVAVSEVQSA